jgi:excinuclease ABC subunit A
MIINGKQVDISNEISIDEDDVRDMDAIVDRFIVSQKHEKAIKAGIAATLLTGDGLMRVEVLKGASKQEMEGFHKALCSTTHHLVYGGIEPEYFMFNNPESACRTCGGLGVHKITHPELLVPDPKRSIRGGCFLKEAYKYNPDTWDGRIVYSLSRVLNFSLETPWQDLPESVRHRASSGCERQTGQIPGPRGRLPRDCPPHRAALSALSPTGRGQFRYGSVARSSHGGANLPRLRGRAPAGHTSALHHRGQNNPRRWQSPFR